MRLGDSERDVLFDQLKQHAAAGRLSVEELERRVGLIAAAETSEDAAIALADLPPLSSPEGEPNAARPRWRRGHAERDAPAPDWQPTAERFRDPRSGRIMRVWVDAGGGRHYVPDAGG